MKKVLHIALFVTFVAAVAALMGFIYVEQGNDKIAATKILIDHQGDKGFLNENIIQGIINNGDSLINKQISTINVREVEEKILENPFVRSADVFIDLDENLVIRVKEKKPILRIFNRNKEGFYLDDEGMLFPLSEYYSPLVRVANGYLDIDLQGKQFSVYDSVFSDTPLADLFDLSCIIRKNRFLDAQIGEIYVNSKGEFDLLPQLGNHLVQFGTMEDAEKKLDNLELFYRKALIREGWNKYEIINIKYKNQVVCKRK